MTHNDEDFDIDILNNFDKDSDNNLPSTDVLGAESKDAENLEKDYEYAKAKLKQILETSEEVMLTAAEVAIETGEPRAIEVYGTLVKNLSEISKSVLESNKTKSSVKKDNADIKDMKAGNKKQPVTTNNAIFIGTIKDILNDMNSQNTIDITPEDN